MLKRTKSANKGVLNEQSSLQHTAVTAAGLPSLYSDSNRFYSALISRVQPHSIEPLGVLAVV